MAARGGANPHEYHSANQPAAIRFAGASTNVQHHARGYERRQYGTEALQLRDRIPAPPQLQHLLRQGLLRGDYEIVAMWVFGAYAGTMIGANHDPIYHLCARVVGLPPFMKWAVYRSSTYCKRPNGGG